VVLVKTGVSKKPGDISFEKSQKFPFLLLKYICSLYEFRIILRTLREASNLWIR
jgi:hypothetical protein